MISEGSFPIRSWLQSYKKDMVSFILFGSSISFGSIIGGARNWARLGEWTIETS